MERIVAVLFVSRMIDWSASFSKSHDLLGEAP
jgi:hypothetical protein